MSLAEPSRAERPIGVFDSGVGGLTVLHECLVSLPEENFLYIGDNGHFPYGTKTEAELQDRARAIVGYLIDRDVKLIVVACNSATAAAGPLVHELAEAEGIPVLTVIYPEAEIASAITYNGKVGVLATPATVASGAYRRALDSQGRLLTVTEVAAPDLAPMIQNDLSFDDELINAVRGYAAPLHEAGVDTLILGCTHYPLIAPAIQRILGRDVRLVTAGHAIAGAIQRELASTDSLNPGPGEGEYSFLVTGDVEAFVEDGARFLQLPLSGRVQKTGV